MPATAARTIGQPAPKRQGSRKRAAAKRSQAAAPSLPTGELSAKHVAIAMSPANPLHHEALEFLRRATPEQREAVCPAGLAGKQRKLFINDGVTVRHTVAVAQQGRTLAAAHAHAKSKESNMTTSTATPKSTTRTRKSAEKATSTRTKQRADKPAVTVVTASSIAKDNGLDATAFRKWLRAEDLRDEQRAAVFSDKRKLTALIKRFVKAQAAVTK